MLAYVKGRGREDLGRVSCKRRAESVVVLQVRGAVHASSTSVLQMVGSVDFCLNSSPPCMPKGSGMRRQLRISLLTDAYQDCLTRKAASVAVHSWHRSRAPAAYRCGVTGGVW